MQQDDWRELRASHQARQEIACPGQRSLRDMLVRPASSLRAPNARTGRGVPRTPTSASASRRSSSAPELFQDEQRVVFQACTSCHRAGAHSSARKNDPDHALQILSQVVELASTVRAGFIACRGSRAAAQRDRIPAQQGFPERSAAAETLRPAIDLGSEVALDRSSAAELIVSCCARYLGGGRLVQL